MRLSIPSFRIAIPVLSYAAPDDPHGEAIVVRVPSNDPRAIGIVPGMEGDLEFDDGRHQRIRIGKRWRTVNKGENLRIAVCSEAVVVPATP